MLISFEVENWMSFRDSSKVSFVASRERQHRERLPRLKKYDMTILPATALYGGNASGKTAFFAAIGFIKRMVVDGTKPNQPIPVKPYRLEKECLDKASTFRIELLVKNTIYEYSFSATRQMILSESLIEISTTKEKSLFIRTGKDIDFDDKLKKDERLKFIFEGTRKNQLFLTNSISQNADYFKDVYDWFNDTLIMISPETSFGPSFQFTDEKYPLFKKINQILGSLDTGVVGIEGEEYPLERLPDEIIRQLEEGVEEEAAAKVSINKNEILVTRKNGKLEASRVVTIHKNNGGERVQFELENESDGTLRVINLLPAFIELLDFSSSHVCIIDEIDRSLHTLMLRYLLKWYLDNCNSEQRSQLLFTTHDVMLMDQDLFRRDEMWVVERDQAGCSAIWSFSDFKNVRYDKDIRKSYLQGRLGGIPRFLLGTSLNCIKNNDY